MAWGLVLALLAAVCFGVAAIFEAMAARSVGDAALGPRLMMRVLRQWRFIVGLGLDALGFVAQAAAWRLLPLFVVQSALAASLAVTALVATWILRVRLGRREWWAIVAVCVGLAAVGSSAQEGGASTSTGVVWPWLLLALVVLVGLAFVPKLRPALGLVGGCLFGLAAIGGRVIDWFSIERVFTDPAAYIVIAAGGCGLWCYTAALQRGAVTSATALLVLGETVPPTVVGVAAFGDRAVPGLAPVACVGFVLAVGGALLLSRFGEVGPARDDEDTGSATLTR